MAYTDQEVQSYIENIYANGGTASDVARAAVEFGVSADQIANVTGQNVESVANQLVNELYIQQLGRAPDEEGGQYYANLLAQGKTPTEIASELNQSLEGQNFDTQYLTSQYRQLFERNPEQEGYQYWQSLAQTDPLMYGEILRQAIISGAQGNDITAYQQGGGAYTNIVSPDLEADPYGGRYATTSIYDLPSDAVNISNLNGRQVQFVAPVTQQPVISQFAQAYADRNVSDYIQGKLQGVDVNNPQALQDAYTSIYRDAQSYNVSPEQISRVLPFTVSQIQQFGTENQLGNLQTQFSASQGLDVLSSPVVSAAVARALNSGAMSQAEYETMVGDLTKATSMNDVYAAFNKPQAQVVMDAVYGLQTGQGNTLAEAQARAADIQPLIDAINQGYYPSNMSVAAEAQRQGVPYAFGPEAYQGYNTMMTQGDVVTDANFKNKVNQVIKNLYGRFGQENTLQTPLTGSYYSERGLESGYTPLGVAGNPVFRSGVAGYTPTLPTGFQFGIPPVNAVVPQFIPGKFTAQFDANGNLITAPTAPTVVDTTGA